MRFRVSTRPRPLTAGLGLTVVLLGLHATVAPALATPASAVSTDPGDRVPARQVTPRWSGAVDTRVRSEVETSWWGHWVPSASVPIGWTGSVTGCRAGAVSSASRAATLRAVNFSRSVNGLAPVTLDPSLDGPAQRAALVMDANDALSHEPPRSWRCWSSSAAGAAGRSNLALWGGQPLGSGDVVRLYLTDSGANNAAVGHRRWVMYPFTTAMGNGSTSTANALTVIGTTSAGRPNPAYTSWPSAGWFPTPLLPGGRWSMSTGFAGADVTRARVRVWRGSAPVPVTRLAVQDGYGMPTLVWHLPAHFTRSGTYRVVVDRIAHAGTARTWTRSYAVKLFTPRR